MTMRGMIDRLAPEGRFGFLKAEDGREFYFQEEALEATAFDELRPGTVVEFSPDESSPGDVANPTAIQVRLAPEAPEQPERVNVDRGGSLEQEPPPSVEGDEVTEASWESFPSSDPPSPRNIT